MEQLPGLILQLYITSSQNPLCYNELAGGAREDDDERSDSYCVIMIYAAVSLHWQLIRNQRIVGRLSGFDYSLDLAYLHQGEELNMTFVSGDFRKRKNSRCLFASRFDTLT